MVKIVVWNANCRQQALEQLVEMDADVALLQEVYASGWEWLPKQRSSIEVSPHVPWAPWQRTDYNRYPLVVKLSDRVQVDWFEPKYPSPWMRESNRGRRHRHSRGCPDHAQVRGALYRGVHLRSVARTASNRRR